MFILLKRLASVTFIALLLFWIFRHLKGFESETGPDHEKVISFNWHVLLMSISFLLLMVEGAAAFRLPSGAKMETTAPMRPAAKKYHMLTMLVAIIFGTAGIVIIFVNHAKKNIPHLYSAHSWYGIATVSLVALQFAVGFYFFWLASAPQYLKQLVLPWHQLAGKCIVFLAMGTIAMGLLEKQAFLNNKWSAGSMWAGALALFLIPLGALLAITFTYRPPVHQTENSGTLLASDSDS